MLAQQVDGPAVFPEALDNPGEQLVQTRQFGGRPITPSGVARHTANPVGRTSCGPRFLGHGIGVNEALQRTASLEKIEPPIVERLRLARRRREKVEEFSAKRGRVLRQRDQGVGIWLPEPNGGFGGGRGVDQIGDGGSVFDRRIAARGPGHSVHFVGHPGPWGQASQRPLEAQRVERLISCAGLCRLREITRVVGERLRGQCAGERELEKGLAATLLVDRQVIGPFGFACLAKHSGRLRRVSAIDERPPRLLEEGGQKMRNRAAQPIRNLLVAILRITGLRDSDPAEFFHFFDDVERVARVLRVLLDDGRREAERSLPSSGNRRCGGLRLGKPQELHCKVLGFRERILGEPDHWAFAQRGVTILAGGHGHGWRLDFVG